MNKLLKVMSLVMISSFLTSCSFIDNLLSGINNQTSRNNDKDSSYLTKPIDTSPYKSPEEEMTLQKGSIHTDVGTSRDLINIAFNGSEEERYASFEEYESTTIVEGETKRLNFTKNIQTLEYNEGYITPSKGTIKALVIPIDFIDVPISSDEKRNPSKADWMSVSSFYYNSSYGQLDLQFTILDWYTCQYKSSYYANYKGREFEGEVPGVSAIIAEAIDYYSYKIDFRNYDQNKDGYIDSLYIVYNHEIDYRNAGFWWAYQYAFNECDDKNYKYNGVSPYSYMFAGYDFFFQDSDGRPASCDTATIIHETGHMLGIEDYYDYDEKKGYNKGGFAGADLMHATIGDHNSYSKMAYGWINPILVDFDSTKKDSIDVKLKSLQDSGDVLMICDNYDSQKGMFQSYFLLEYYTPTKIQEYHKIYSKRGIRLLRVNAELETKTDSYKPYEYFKYDNSYSDLNFVDVICNDKIGEGVYSSNNFNFFNDKASSANLYSVGNSRGSKFSQNREMLYNTTNKKSAYSFKVINLTNQEATIRIYKN